MGLSARNDENRSVERRVSGLIPVEVFGSHGLVRIVEINRNFLAEADYGRVDFKRGIRNDRSHRVA
jgi:hypothetical protein